MIHCCTAHVQRTGCAEAHWVVDELQLLGKAISLVQNDPAHHICIGLSDEYMTRSMFLFTENGHGLRPSMVSCTLCYLHYILRTNWISKKVP